MIIYIKDNYNEVCALAADLIELQIKHKPSSILGLATGASPVGVYDALIEKHKQGMSFKHVTTFNLDEYVGISGDHKNSYKYFMQTNLFDHIDIHYDKTHIPCGMAIPAKEECKRYDDSISAKGGIDLQLLGLGQNGHIGFNEPNLEFANGTHLVALDDSTKSANSKYFAVDEHVPSQAITMGIKTIMKAKKILLIATGSSKAEAVKGMIEGNISPKLPASVLQLHQDVVVILDQEAASQLKSKY